MAKKKQPPEVLEYFRKQGGKGGKKGGRLGGLATAAKLTPEERVASAKKASNAAAAARKAKSRAKRKG